MSDNRRVLIRLEDVKMHFQLKKSLGFGRSDKKVKAVDGLSLDIYEREIFGLVGESGCGKSTLGKVILQLHKATSGSISYDGLELNKLAERDMRKLRQKLQIVFQDPYASLNPRLTVGQLISEALIAHGMFKKGEKALEEYTLSVMEKCGLQSHMLHRYPHQFSGGQRQRIGIARALALNPRFVVCDECVSTLDVSIQAQIINLLLDLQESDKLTYLFISHDLNVVRFISDRIGVMYLGNLVELAETDDLFSKPLHPYTLGLLSAISDPDAERREYSNMIVGDVPSPVNPPTGCKFHPRCPHAKDVCGVDVPMWREHMPKHFVACHFPQA